MRKVCATCGEPFDAVRASAKFCGERCKKRAQRSAPAGGGGNLVELAGSVADGPLTVATRKRLEAIGRVGSELGAAVVLLAERLDAAGRLETGASVAALMKEYRATLAEAVKDADEAGDALDEVRGSAALKLIRGSRSA